jgi:hypothetical protein
MDGDSGDVTLDVDINAGTPPFAEAAAIHAKLSLDATQGSFFLPVLHFVHVIVALTSSHPSFSSIFLTAAALWREDHRAPSEDSTILSFSFTTEEVRHI